MRDGIMAYLEPVPKVRLRNPKLRIEAVLILAPIPYFFLFLESQIHKHTKGFQRQGPKIVNLVKNMKNR